MSSRPKLNLALALCLALLISAIESNAQETTPQRMNMTVLEREGSNHCPLAEMWERELNEHKQKILSLLSTTDPLYTCNGTPGWRQVVFINMTNTSYNCPPGLKLTSYSKRTCGRAHYNWVGCSSTTFSVGGSEYSNVCGRIRGYQVGSTDAFLAYLHNHRSLEGSYIAGVSLTHGPIGGRQHIWTFAAGLHEVERNLVTSQNIPWSYYQCPCDVSDANVASPPYVGNDYFCESGLQSFWPGSKAYGVPFLDDTLWDGRNCIATSTCCQFNNPPWFTKTLPNPTTDNIELRVCLTRTYAHEDVALELIELYVQ